MTEQTQFEEIETAEQFDEGMILEHPTRGNHYEITRDGMFELGLEEVETGRPLTVDKRRVEDEYQIEVAG